MEREQWHLDKRVPLALIFVILAQTAAAGWWLSNISARLLAVEMWQSNNAALERRLTRIETILERIDRKTDTKP